LYAQIWPAADFCDGSRKSHRWNSAAVRSNSFALSMRLSLPDVAHLESSWVAANYGSDAAGGLRSRSYPNQHSHRQSAGLLSWKRTGLLAELRISFDAASHRNLRCGHRYGPSCHGLQTRGYE